jgi:tyrosinase
MSAFTRKNVWNQNGTFDNEDLLWYAKAVRVMQDSPVSNPVSWWSYAAIHGEFLLPDSLIPPPPPPPDYRYLNWVNIKYISSSAKLNNLPSSNLSDLFWGQCQHGTWFFAPWHRGYLVALENILRDIIIKQLKGPADWALPYWNYLNQSAANPEYKIPPAFTVQQLPDGTANPLYVPERYGKKVTVGGSEIENAANDECQWDTVYNDGLNPFPTGKNNHTGYFYGGGETGFEPGGKKKGDLEDNPHNGVHGMIGGNRNNDENDEMGLMGIPNTAALDPIFYLHHANIDRMWAAWNETGKNPNSPEPDWLTGPTAQGDRHFAMPLDSKGTPWFYTPEDVESTTDLKYYGAAYSYTYDDLSLVSYSTTPPADFMMNLFERFTKLGIRQGKDFKMANKINTELVGASTGPITLKGAQTNADVKLNNTSWKSVSKSLLESSRSAMPDEVYLELEGVKGGSDTNFLSVYVNEKFVKSVSLFGLLSASLKNSAHGGGLNFKFNITDIVDDMHLEGNIDVNSLNIQIKTKRPLPEDGGITIDRIGVYRAGQ